MHLSAIFLIYITIHGVVVDAKTPGQGQGQKGRSIEPPPAENEVVPLLPIEGEKSPGDRSGNPFSLSGDASNQKNILTFRLSNRLAVAVCDTYDNYLGSGKPYVGQIHYNATIQTLRSPVPPSTCQSFRVKRCITPNSQTPAECGWTKVDSC